MDQAKIAAAQDKVRVQAAKTNAPEDLVERAVTSVSDNAIKVEAGSPLEHFAGGVLNVTVFDVGHGPACRINVTTRTGRMLSVQVELD